MEKSVKPIQTILIESIVVGVGLIIFYNILDPLFKFIKIDYGMYFTFFMSGFIFHILAELYLASSGSS